MFHDARSCRRPAFRTRELEGADTHLCSSSLPCSWPPAKEKGVQRGRSLPSLVACPREVLVLFCMLIRQPILFLEGSLVFVTFPQRFLARGKQWVAAPLSLCHAFAHSLATYMHQALCQVLEVQCTPSTAAP